MTAALKQALELLREDRDALLECHTSPATGAIPRSDTAALEALARYDAAIAAAEAELSQPARVRLNGAQIIAEFRRIQGTEDSPMVFDCHDFAEGVRFAERAHNIPAAQEGN